MTTVLGGALLLAGTTAAQHDTAPTGPAGPARSAAPGNAPPVADLDLNPATGPAPLVITADASGSTDDVEITGYAINWGDGSGKDKQPEATATHTYDRPGTYRLTVTVTDAGRRSARATATVVVTGTPGAPAPPTARLEARPTPEFGALSASFDAGGSTAGLQLKYAFDFGDGTSIVPQPASTVRHVFPAPGTYAVRLTVVDARGRTDSVTTEVTVGADRADGAGAGGSARAGTGAGTALAPAAASPTVVTFTFDDTLASQVPAADLLARHGMRGTFYVNSPRVGSGSSPYFTRAQVDGLRAQGHEVGGHTLGHVDLATVNETEQVHQMCDDRSRLTALGYGVSSLAYPFGSYDAAVQRGAAGCPFDSARGVGDLRSPGYGCLSCATAETIPPADPYQIRTNSSIKSDTTVPMLQNYVTQAQDDRGGWVPLVIHHVCSGCATNAITLADLTTFVQWLATQPNTQVRTVAEVMGGATPTPTATATPTPTSTATATPTTTATATPTPTTTTTPTPTTTATPTPTPTATSTPLPTNPRSVTIAGRTRTITRVNLARTTDSLVYYDARWGTSTRTNTYGYEAAVVGGTITRVADGVGNMPIPSNGYVLSGHGTSRTWLRTYAKVGAVVTLK